jgi:hypothetical protein
MNETNNAPIVQRTDPLALPAHESNRKHILRALLLQRWVTIGGIVLLGVIYLFLPESLTIGPDWLPLAIEVVLILPFAYALAMHRHLPHRLTRTLGFLLAGVATLALLASITLLIITLPARGTAQAGGLLFDAAILWVSNILVFGLWFWEIDGGGPTNRHLIGHKAVDFLFPQQANSTSQKWAAHFVDYVFVAFTNATAFSPTDTAPLSRTAKLLMMVEAIISLIIVAMLAARAINIL